MVRGVPGSSSTSGEPLSYRAVPHSPAGGGFPGVSECQYTQKHTHTQATHGYTDRKHDTVSRIPPALTVACCGLSEQHESIRSKTTFLGEG